MFLLAWQSKEVLESVISWPTKDLSRQLAVSQGQKGKEREFSLQQPTQESKTAVYLVVAGTGLKGNHQLCARVISWPTKDLSRQLAVSQGQKGKETNGLMSWQDIILKEVPAIGSSLLSTFLLHH